MEKQQKPIHFSKNPNLGDVEKMAMAAVRGLSFEESGVKDTPQNRKDFIDVVKDFEETKVNGDIFEIPS